MSRDLLRVVEVTDDETEYKQSLPALIFDAPVTTNELWIFKLVSVVMERPGISVS